MSIQLDEFLKPEYTCVTNTQFKKQNITKEAAFQLPIHGRVCELPGVSSPPVCDPSQADEVNFVNVATV